MKCKYCNKPAGFFRNKHKECEEIYNKSIDSLKSLYQSEISQKLTHYDDLKAKATEIIKGGFISEKENLELLAHAADRMFSIYSVESKEDCDRISKCFETLPQEIQLKIKQSVEYREFWQTVTMNLLQNAIDTDGDIKQAEDFARSKGVSLNDINKCYINNIEAKIIKFLDDGLITTDEEKEISETMEKCSLTAEDFIGNATYEKLVQALLLRDLGEGKDISHRIRTDSLPILLGKSEYLIWGYSNISAYEEKTGKRYEGGSRGVSVRICKGVYYRIGASKGHAVDYSYTNPIGSGILAITNKNIIFHGQKAIKIPIGKIISFTAYSDGIELQKDGVRAKPVTFTGFDPWFLSNLLQLLQD